MTWAAYIACYLAVGYLALALFALRDSWGSPRALFILSILWPVLFVLVPWALIEPKVPYRFNLEMRRDLSAFGVRRPEKTWGIALRVCWVEVQVWRVRTR